MGGKKSLSEREIKYYDLYLQYVDVDGDFVGRKDIW